MSLAERDAREWLRFAVEDLDQAERILKQGDFVPRHPGWLAQQAAEKALKSALIAGNRNFPRTHDLDVLLEMLPEEWGVKALEVDLSMLTEFAVDARYPGDFPDVTDEEARKAVLYARRIVVAIRARLE